jgi:DMSO/TMAO reductase YedYZ molybdopterin-dependent catalytic subunit
MAISWGSVDRIFLNLTIPKPLPREHGGPVRMITPKLYAWKGAKWIRKIEFLAEDRKGFWEVRGYSNSAEPWFNDRYVTE